VRPEVGEEGEAVTLLFPPGTQGVPGIDRDADQFDTAVGEQPQVVAQLAQLAAADTGERQREEHQRDRLLTPVATELDAFAVLADQLEIGCLGVVLQSHGGCPFRPPGNGG